MTNIGRTDHFRADAFPATTGRAAPLDGTLNGTVLGFTTEEWGRHSRTLAMFCVQGEAFGFPDSVW
jgi:hypothetical protein